MESPTSKKINYRKPYVIGIAGGSGAGKTFFLNRFLQHFVPQQIAIISLDNYYIPANTKTKEENRLYNFDLPNTFYKDEFYHDILALIKGKAISRQKYTFNNPQSTSQPLEVHPAPILLIEGLFILHFQEVNELLDHRIFIHADGDIALKRRIKRDFIERGYDEADVKHKWENHVMPAYHKYLLPYKELCDQIIDNSEDNGENVISIIDLLATYLKQSFF